MSASRPSEPPSGGQQSEKPKWYPDVQQMQVGTFANGGEITFRPDTIDKNGGGVDPKFFAAQRCELLMESVADWHPHFRFDPSCETTQQQLGKLLHAWYKAQNDNAPLDPGILDLPWYPDPQDVNGMHRMGVGKDDAGNEITVAFIFRSDSKPHSFYQVHHTKTSRLKVESVAEWYDPLEHQSEGHLAHAKKVRRVWFERVSMSIPLPWYLRSWRMGIGKTTQGLEVTFKCLFDESDTITPVFFEGENWTRLTLADLARWNVALYTESERARTHRRIIDAWFKHPSWSTTSPSPADSELPWYPKLGLMGVGKDSAGEEITTKYYFESGKCLYFQGESTLSGSVDYEAVTNWYPPLQRNTAIEEHERRVGDAWVAHPCNVIMAHSLPATTMNTPSTGSTQTSSQPSGLSQTGLTASSTGQTDLDLSEGEISDEELESRLIDGLS